MRKTAKSLHTALDSENTGRTASKICCLYSENRINKIIQEVI